MSEPTIKKNIFTNNLAGEGGGIYVYGNVVNPNNPTEPVIAGNIFINNKAIVNHGFRPPDNNYPYNDNGDGGAFVDFQACDATITGNIQNNFADYYGGGINLRQRQTTALSSKINYLTTFQTSEAESTLLTIRAQPLIKTL